MTDKQKEAIERLNLHKVLAQINNDCCIVNVKDVETALNLIQTQQAEIEKKDKMIDKIQKEVRDHIGFENRLKRDNKEPDLFNQGRFYVANNINNILKGKVENGN